MAKLPAKPLDPKKDSQFFNDLVSAISSLNDKKEIRGFLLDLLTHTERKMISKRLQIAALLLKGERYPEIREKTEATDVTIAKISNWLESGAVDLRRVAKKVGKGSGYIKKSFRSSEKHLAGDLLTPAIEEGVSLIAGKIAKKKRKV